MIISDISKFCTEEIVEIIKKLLNANKEEGMRIIGKIVCLGKISIRNASKIFNLSRQTIRKAVDIFNNVRLYHLEHETRGNKKYEEKHPEIIDQIKTICDNSENVDKSLRGNIIYIDISAGYIIEKLQSDYNYSKENCPCENNPSCSAEECNIV